MRPSYNRLVFADAVFDSIGQVPIPLTKRKCKTKHIRSNVFLDAYIPALPGMDLLDGESLTPSTLSKWLVKRIKEHRDKYEVEYIDVWSVPLHRAQIPHIYANIDLSTKTFFNRTDIVRLHCQFYHPM